MKAQAKRPRPHALLLALALAAAAGCQSRGGAAGAPGARATPQPTRQQTPRVSYESPVLERLVAAAVERTKHSVTYDPAYYSIPYPGGDVPADKGVCTDEIIRSYRAVGVDLQKEVHEDMAANFAAYPRKFGMTRPDTNIDHRRVPNLMTFFERKGRALPVTDDAADYRPGDVLTWDLGGGLTHIGILTDAPSATPGRYLVMHNMGAGPRLEDVIFSWKLTGHYRYTGPPPTPTPTPTPARRAPRNRR
jgi:uncharacterized protein YijF (DUF1287 family)